jgi:hypothetical protein
LEENGMKTLIQGGYVVGFNGKNHEILKEGVVVFEKDTISLRRRSPSWGISASWGRR